MTDTEDKIRGLFLAALMVLSVFAMTVSFTGAVGAQTVAEAVEYDEGQIEVVFESSSTADISPSSVTIEVTDPAGETTTYTTDNADIGVSGSGQSRDITLQQQDADGNLQPVDLLPSHDVTLEISSVTDTPVTVRTTGVTASMPAATDQDSNPVNNIPGPLYAGTPVAIVTNNPDEAITVTRDGEFVTRRSTGSGSDVFVFDSADAVTGAEYSFDADASDQGAVNATFSEFSLSTETPDSATTDSVTVTATANDIDRTIVFALVDSDGTIVDSGTQDLNSNGVASLDLQTENTGTYTFVATDADSGVSATSGEFEVASGLSAGISLAEDTVVEQTGDKARITLNFVDEGQARVTLGDAQDLNFEITFDVFDGSDGTVTVELDTLQTTESDMVSVVSTGDDTDRVEFVNAEQGVESPLDPAEYPLIIQSPADTEGEFNDEDFGSFVLEDRSTTGVTTYSTVATSDALDDRATIVDSIAGETSEITTEDSLVIAVEANGVYSTLGDGDQATLADAPDDSNGDGLSMSIKRPPESEINQEETPESLGLNNADHMVTDPANDTFYVVFNDPAVNADEEWRVNFTVHDDYAAGGAGQVQTSFTTAAPTLTVSYTGDSIILPPSEGATVAGTSNLPPGTEITVRLRAPTGETPFSVETSPPVEVQSDGSWSATFDLSDIADGQQFTATVRAPQVDNLGEHLDTYPIEIDGEIGEVSASVSMSDQAAREGGSLVVVDSVEMSQGGFIAIHLGSQSGDVIGSSGYISGSDSNVQIRLDPGASITSETTLVAMAHQDTDGDQTFDYTVSGEDDGPYLVNGAPVVSSATVSPEGTTPEPMTDTPTTPDTDTATPDQDGDGDGIPGFGAGLAVVALLGAALLAARRRQ